MENKDAIVSRIKEMVRVEEGDDTEILEFNGGKLLLVQVPTKRLINASTYDAAITSVAAATTLAIVDQFNIDAFNASTVKRPAGAVILTPRKGRVRLSHPSSRSRRTMRASATRSATSRSTMSS